MGLERISERRYYVQNYNGTFANAYCVYDCHGSVRALTDATGGVTDTYDYDAYGNLIDSTFTGSAPTPNNYLFVGEEFDPDLNLYYNRARYLNVSTGRFWSADTYEGDPQSPLSLHRYLNTGANPINLLDPSGNDDLADVPGALTLASIILNGASFLYHLHIFIKRSRRIAPRNRRSKPLSSIQTLLVYSWLLSEAGSPGRRVLLPQLAAGS